MARDGNEPNRFLGFPVKKDFTGFPPKKDRQAQQVEEPQRVMGIPVDLSTLFNDVDLDALRPLAHPIREYRRWRRRRRLGPYATDEGDDSLR